MGNVVQLRSRPATEAYRDGWERTFAPRPTPKMLRCPFPLRRGMMIDLEVPSDLRLADLARLVSYLVTMCEDWDSDAGFPRFDFCSLATGVSAVRWWTATAPIVGTIRPRKYGRGA